MWLRDMLLSLVRLWYIVLTGLMATAYLCFFLSQTVPASYKAHGSLVMMPPNATVGRDGNPFLFLGGMSQALDIIAAKVSSEDVAKPIVDPYPGTSYVAEPDRSTSGSVLLISVVSANPNDLMRVLESSVAAVPKVLKEMQDAQNIPADSRIGLMTLVVDRDPTEDTKTRMASVLGAGGVGAALTVLLTGFIDGRILARRQRMDDDARSNPSREPLRQRRRAKERPSQNAVTVVEEPPRTESSVASQTDILPTAGHTAAGGPFPAKSKV